MRKILASAALAGLMTVTGLAVTPTAQAAVQTHNGNEGGEWPMLAKSADSKAFTFGETWKRGDEVVVEWYGDNTKADTGKKAWAVFVYYKNGAWRTFSRSWDGPKVGSSWSGRGISEIYTYTCREGRRSNCGPKIRIY